SSGIHRSRTAAPDVLTAGSPTSGAPTASGASTSGPLLRTPDMPLTHHQRIAIAEALHAGGVVAAIAALLGVPYDRAWGYVHSRRLRALKQRSRANIRRRQLGLAPLPPLAPLPRGPGLGGAARSTPPEPHEGGGSC